MNLVGNHYEIRHEQGFDVFVLMNQQVELSVVPELGARIISLKDLRTGREWLWHPPGKRKLFRNHPGDDFARSPLVGMDECLPTIAPCAWQGRTLPDHGEVWSAAWAVDEQAWDNGILQTHTQLSISPLRLERSIELSEREIRLDYCLINHGPNEESYLWAMHPLLQLQPGDELDLPGCTRALLNGANWIDALGSAIPQGNCQKLFARPVKQGWAAVHNPGRGDRLRFEWDVAQNDTLGLWLTRGGWNGLHHFALEPGNGEPDELAEAAMHRRCGTVKPNEPVTWRVSLRVGK
jgi:hypothetical protein